MIFPSLSQYLSIMLYPKGHFATLAKVKAVVDDNGEPMFQSSRHSVLFLADVNGKRCSLRFFTRPVNDIACGGLIKNELILSDGARLDIVVEAPFVVEDKVESESENYCEGRAIIECGGKFGFVDENGVVVVEPKYDKVDNFSESRAIVVQGDFYGLIDVDGVEVIAPEWDDLSYDGSSLCYVERDGLCGVIDRMGSVISKPVWDWTGEYCCGMLLVERDKKYGFLDMNGEIVIDIQYDDATSFDSNRYATVRLGERQYQIDTKQNRV